MGNAATCSLVDVVGTVTVTQTDGQILEFVQPIFASQVKKLHPGNWLVHYVSAMHDPTMGLGHGKPQNQHSKMSMLQGNEELHAGEIYFLLPIPSHFRKQLFGSSKHRSSSVSSNSSSISSSNSSKVSAHPITPASAAGPPTKQPQAQQHAHVQHFSGDGSMARRQESSPVFALSGSASFSAPAPPPPQVVVQPRPHKRCSSRHRIHVFDWRPSLMTIQEAF